MLGLNAEPEPALAPFNETRQSSRRHLDVAWPLLNHRPKLCDELLQLLQLPFAVVTDVDLILDKLQALDNSSANFLE